MGSTSGVSTLPERTRVPIDALSVSMIDANAVSFGYGLPLHRLIKAENESRVPTDLLRPVRRRAELAEIERAMLAYGLSRGQLGAMYFGRRIKK